MHFFSLGSGSKRNATLVETSRPRLLVDCGFGAWEVQQQLQQVGVTAQDLDADPGYPRTWRPCAGGKGPCFSGRKVAFESAMFGWRRIRRPTTPVSLVSSSWSPRAQGWVCWRIRVTSLPTRGICCENAMPWWSSATTTPTYWAGGLILLRYEHGWAVDTATSATGRPRTTRQSSLGKVEPPIGGPYQREKQPPPLRAWGPAPGVRRSGAKVGLAGQDLLRTLAGAL